MVYEIQKLNPNVKRIIEIKNLDKDGDGKIDEKELPLLFKHGIKERRGNIGPAIAIGVPMGFVGAVTAAGLLVALGEIFTGGWMSLSPDHPMYDKAPIQHPLTGTWIERNYKHPKMVKIGRFLNGVTKNGAIVTNGVVILAGLATLGLCIYEALKEKTLYVPEKPAGNGPKNTPVPVDSLEQKFTDGFNSLGVEKGTKLLKYTPKRGENWSGILKAKYGTDDATAGRMAHRIKDVIYGDSLASKQTPVMYFPRTWNFNGKIYNYNDTASVVAGKIGGNVQTDMGKMNEHIEY